MKETDLRSVLSDIGVTAGRASSKGWVSFPCPLAPWTHKSGRDKSPSAAALIVDDGTSVWSCQACKHKGTITNLVSKVTRFRAGAPDAVKVKKAEEAEAVGTFVYKPPGAAVIQNAPPLGAALEEAIYDGVFEPASSDPEALGYLSMRGINGATADHLDLLFDPEDRRILFPVRDDAGGLHGFTGRAIDGREPKIKDYLGLPKRHLILGEHRWRQGFPKIIVEGLFGYAHMHQIGADEFADIGALLGSEITPEKASRIVKHFAPTFLFLDNDEAGETCLFGRRDPVTKQRDFSTGGLAKILGHVPCMVPEWPKRPDGSSKEDPDELTLEDVRAMMRVPPFFRPVPPRRPAKSLKKVAAAKPVFSFHALTTKR